MILDGGDRQSAVAVELSNDSDLCTVILDRFLDESAQLAAAHAVPLDESAQPAAAHAVLPNESDQQAAAPDVHPDGSS